MKPCKHKIVKNRAVKGPQGTLFGRNTTGGAVLLSPKRPTEELEGYVEGSVGNYDMRRTQGVINIPVNDSVRVRFGIDSQTRDGYLNNITGIGPGEFADIDYTAFRGSIVWDITDNLENYTIIKYNTSSNNGSPYSVPYCNPTAQPFGSFCSADLAARDAIGGNGFYDVASTVEKSYSDQELAQAINTTTWEVSDNLTIKNIISYAEQTIEQQYSIYGTDWNLSALSPALAPLPVTFQFLGGNDNMPIADSSTLVEELQFQGTALEQRLTWQAGLYYEKTKPKKDYGSQGPATIACDTSTVSSSNPDDFRCNDVFASLFGLPNFGSIASNPGGVEYTNQAVYAQGSYAFTDQLSLTLGLRYTNDETKGYIEESIYYFPSNPVAATYYPYSSSYTEVRTPESSSEEPTWLIGLDYNPTENTLLFAKYARGYRQGSINLGAPAGLDTHEPEQVDTYEVGAKTSFVAPVPGTFNISLFYNDFVNQQVQQGIYRTSGVGSTIILNAGSSEIWGVEADTVLQLTENFTLTAGYAYLDSEVKELNSPLEGLSQGDLFARGIAILSGFTTAEGESLSYTPKNKLVLTAAYTLPVTETLGTISAAATFVYTDEMQAVSEATSPYAILPDYDVVNVNLNWKNVAGSSVDLALFGTNVFDKEYYTYLSGNWNNGLEAVRTGQPRMYGLRVKYNF